MEPVFLVGSIRSGTTLLRLMLDHHPRISFQHESEFMFNACEEGRPFPSTEEFVRQLEQDWIYQRSGLKVNPVLAYPEAVDDLLGQKAAADRKPIVGATVHHHMWVPARLYPNARFIHIVRDGRDVANSVCQMGVQGNLYYAADTWLQAISEWESIREKLRPDQFIEVRFEELIQSPQDVLERICRFLGVEYSPEMLSYPGRSTYEAPDKRAVSRWQAWPVSRLRPVESKIHEPLTRYGYQVKTTGRIGLLGRAWQLVDNWFHLFQFRVRRYGARYLQWQLVRMLPIASWRERARMAMHEIDLLHVK
jgi:hypothetical protein